jgi:predicted nucleic acid-binding protein
MEQIKLYIDTSIPSAYYDTSTPVRQLITQQWFENNASSFDLYISTMTIDELDELKNTEKRQNIKNLLIDHNVTVLDPSAETTDLAKEYMSKGVIPISEPEDAYHIAIASINLLDALASWNFKHIVSVNPIRKIHEINMRHNYPIIEIGSLQLFGGSEYENI